MRVWSRVALVVVLLLSASTLFADHYRADCPLSLADSTPAATRFELSPHGVFRYGSLVFALRGQILTTYTPNDVGNLAISREDFVGSLAARETEGGVAFDNGFLYISSEAGLEIYDLRNVHGGGNAPLLVSRTPGVHYRRMAVSGNRLAGLYPATDLPCYPVSFATPNCNNAIDILDVTSPSAPFLVGQIRSNLNTLTRGLNDVKFNFGYLITVTERALLAFDISNPIAPAMIAIADFAGKWLVSNDGNFIAIGNDSTIDTFAVRPGMSPFFLRTSLLTAPFYLTIERSNAIRFNRTAWFDDDNARLITMIDEVDPLTLKAARTIAFDVFDLTMLQLEGSAERIYEDVTFVREDERKHDPVSVGAYVYVIGEETGLQSWGSCGVVTGRIELESPTHLTCDGAEIHGWVTGRQKIVSVELFLDSTPLGAATLSGIPRNDVSSSTPVTTWRINVDLDDTAAGEYQLRAIGTDAFGNRQQFAQKVLYFAGPGQNCTIPRRRAVR